MNEPIVINPIPSQVPIKIEIGGGSGTPGPRGPQGLQGEPGEIGPQGEPGIQGPKGDTGAQGIQGVKGDTGSQGIQGIKGDTGPQGIQGVKGDTGLQGITGDTGPQGIQGVKGDTGAQGIQGVPGTGIQGPKGDTGAQGIQGVKGDTGTQGIQGIKGDTGAQGGQGVKGDTGSQGLTGPQGNPGPGVPTGGTAGQVLTKSSGTDYATQWSTPTSGGSSNPLLATWKNNPTYWTDDKITIDISANTFTIPAGHTLVNGNEVTIVWIKGALATTLAPAPLLLGRRYYVRMVSGNSFQLATANNDTTLVDLTGLGTSGCWRLEKLSGIASVMFTALDAEKVKLVVRGGGWYTTFASVNLKINGVGDADSYHNSHTSNTNFATNAMYLANAGTLAISRSFIDIDVVCRDQSAYAKYSGNYVIQNDSFLNGFATGAYVFGAAGSTKKDDRFDKISTLEFIIVGQIFGDMIVEVWRA